MIDRKSFRRLADNTLRSPATEEDFQELAEFRRKHWPKTEPTEAQEPTP